MKLARKQTAKAEASFEKEYRSALGEFARRRGETELGRAYDLGRKAMTEGKSLVDIACLHHQTLGEIVGAAKEKIPVEALLRASAEFLAESLSPYEMAHRGFRDSVRELQRLNETLELEIKRIAYSVHDEASQLLTAVHLALAEAARDLPKQSTEKLSYVQNLLIQIESQLRRYSHELRPTVLDDLGLLAAIRFLADGVSKRAKVPIVVNGEYATRLPEASEIGLYRVVQEALKNATKHAHASRILIDVRLEGKSLLLSISDDGVGFDFQLVQARPGQKGLGLTSMKERLTAIGGTLLIDSAAGRGTKLEIYLPIPVEVLGVSSSTAR